MCCLSMFIGVLSYAKALPSEEQCRAVTLAHECQGEPLTGCKAVLQVIEERMRIEHKTACQIVKAPKQFSFVNKRTNWHATEEQLTRYRLADSMPAVGESAYYFCKKNVKRKWTKRNKLVCVIGSHIFYRK